MITPILVVPEDKNVLDLCVIFKITQERVIVIAEKLAEGFFELDSTSIVKTMDKGFALAQDEYELAFISFQIGRIIQKMGILKDNEDVEAAFDIINVLNQFFR